MNFTPEEIVERFVRGDKSRHESGSGIGTGDCEKLHRGTERNIFD